MNLKNTNPGRRHFLKQSVAASAGLLLPGLVIANDVPKTAKSNNAASGDTPKLGAAIKFAKDVQETLKKVNDYEATFTKKELVGKKLLQTEMYVKFREQPFSVYIKYLSPHAGREVIYVAGRNKDKLLAHGEGITSIVGAIKLKPDSKDAMEDNRYPITMFGMSKLVATLLQQWEADEKHDDCVVKFFPNAKLDKVECKVVEITYPKPVPHAKFHLTRMYVAKETGLPVRVEQFGFPAAGAQPPVIEEYTYSNIKINVGFSDVDFDTANQAYGF
jgi:outer membrane lipoprotein-sorting protein